VDTEQVQAWKAPFFPIKKIPVSMEINFIHSQTFVKDLEGYTHVTPDRCAVVMNFEMGSYVSDQLLEIVLTVNHASNVIFIMNI
jgi:hypothetical protein